MAKTLHIIEPTLSGEAGHCSSFIESLCRAAGAAASCFVVWGGRSAGLSDLEDATPRVERYFYRKVRKFQELFLLRRLLKGDGRIFISTAGRVDLMLLNWAARTPVAPGRVFLFFHWVRPDARKLAYFAKIAARHPNLIILGPTPSVVEVFAGCGFRNSHVAPYPITPRTGAENGSGAFSHLLFAGAARRDKGFSHVVRFLAWLKDAGEQVPVSLQTSAAHYDKYDDDTSAALQRLSVLEYPQLRLAPETLSSEDYFQSFQGAICLQLYDPDAFADRISGITLDGLSMGAPLVTLAGTWMARVVERFQAGAVLPAPEPELLWAAVRAIGDDYARYRDNARRAGAALQQEHSAGHLLELLTRDGSQHGN